MSKEYSENEDDPPVYESSGSEWNCTTEVEPKRRSSRRTSRIRKKPRITTDSSSESDFDDPKPRKKNGVSKKQKVENSSQTKKTVKTGTKTINSKDFSTGSFLILKKDALVGDPNKHPCIWRVDGKALLQKYEPFEDEGKIRHRTTSVYTGWSALDRDLYAPVTVTIKYQHNQTMIVDLNWEKLKEINLESD